MAPEAAKRDPSVLPFTNTDTVPLWRDGQEVVSEGGTFEVTSPVDKSLLYKASSANEADVNAAIDAAAAALPKWSTTTPNHRRDILLRAADLFAERWSQLKHFSYHETGATDMTQSIDYDLAFQTIRNTAGLIQTIHGQAPALSTPGQRAIVSREPFGVVLAIAPWNMPFILGLRSVLGPIAAGNTVVLKGSELSPGTFWAIASILHQAGLPAGVLNTVYARPADAVQITTALIAHRAVRKVNFTGSTAVGSSIASTCGKHLKPCVMELGGKAPTIVLEDADLDKAAQGAALGAFFHSGQICMSAERLIVRTEIVDEFAQKLSDIAPKIFGNEGFVLISEAGVQKNQKLMRNALEHGASAVLGHPDTSEISSTRMQPIVVRNPTTDADIYHTESFGPTATIYAVSSDEEAIRIANDTEYGLSSSVFTENLGRGLKIARAIEAGAVHINSMTIHDESVLPHGGIKASGWGRFNADKGLEEWLWTKVTTWMD